MAASKSVCTSLSENNLYNDCLAFNINSLKYCQIVLLVSHLFVSNGNGGYIFKIERGVCVI